MSEWKEYNLKNLLAEKGYIRGPFGSSLKRGEMKSEGTPVYEQEHAIYNRRRFRFFIDDEKTSQLKRFVVKEDDLIISCSGTVGRVSIIKKGDPKGIISQALLLLRPNTEIVYPEYLHYFFKSKEGFNQLVNASEGSVQPNISSRDVVESIPIKIPKRKVQEKILSVLFSLDDKIDLLQRQNKTLEQLAETLFRQWFVDEDDWEEVDLEFVTTRITDGSHFSPATTQTGFPMASVKDMHEWGINTDSCRMISQTDFDNLCKQDCRPLKNDILIAKDGSYLKHIFLCPDNLDVVALSSIAIVRPNGKYNPFLLTTILKTESTIKQLENIVTGGVIPRIVLKDFRKFKIKLPPLSIQVEAASQIEPIYNKCWNNMNQIHTLTQLRDNLLPKLMSGEVSITNQNQQL